MRTLLTYLLALSMSLWLGGLVALVIFVSSLFAYQRDLGVQAAPRLFHVFEIYQLALAALTLLALAAWQAIGPSRWKFAALGGAIIAAVLAVAQIGWITPTINASRGVDPARFDRFHHLASANYSAITLCVAVAGALALAAGQREDHKRRIA